MRVVLIYCRARSGSYYVHSLFDGHPDVLSLPPLKTTRLFFHSSDDLWDSRGNAKFPVDELIRLFVVRNPTLFDARGRAGGQGYDRMGPSQADALTVDPEAFVRFLGTILEASSEDCTRRGFFIAVHQAYDRAVYGVGRKASVIIYQAHNPLDVKGNEGLLRDFPDARLILTMQEAVRSLVSLIYQKDSENIDRVGATGRFILCFKATIHGWRGLLSVVHRSRRIVSCMNVLNRDIKAETTRYCAFADIPWRPEMLLSTFNGVIWNGDIWSKLPAMPDMSAEDVRELRTRAILYRRDELVLQVLSSDVRHVCCFYELPIRHYFVGLLAFHLPMKVEAIAMAEAWRRRSLRDVGRVLYFYVRRVMLSYGSFATAVLRPSEC